MVALSRAYGAVFTERVGDVSLIAVSEDGLPGGAILRPRYRATTVRSAGR
jgi:hypothetical protein